MPFVERSVEPRRLCRLSPGEERSGVAVFSSLDEVSSRALCAVLYQLSDLCRHAGDIFQQVELQAAHISIRTSGIQRRLDHLQSTVKHLDPKKVKIRSMRKKQPGNLGKEREKKEKRTSVSRALSWLSGSTLSRQTRKLFRSHNDLNTLSQTEHGEQEEDDENWVYEPQHYIAVSNLDEESKWTVHYTAPWHQQENVFLPTSRSACVEELHRQAKVNLKTALRECDKLRKDGFRSSQYYSQGPTFSGSAHSQSSQQEDEEEDDIDDKSAPSTAEEEKISNTMSTNSPVQGEGAEVDGQAPRLKPMPLPTPEEKMRQQAQAILTDIVPIDVTGVTFDRQASIRRSLKNVDTLARQPKKVKRRKTISGLPDIVQDELAAKGRGGELRPQSMFIPGHYSTLGRSASVSSTLKRSETKDSGCQTEEVKIVPPSVRRIRAQRGQGIAAQMSGMSTSTNNISTVPDGRSLGSPVHVMAPRLNGDAQRFHSLPRGARVSLSAEPLYSSTPFRAEDSTATAPRQIGKLQVDETVVHLRNTPRISTSVRPKSQEVRGSQGEWGTGTGPACVVSPHAGYSTSLIPNATLSCSAEVIALHAVSSPGRQLLSRSLRTASSVGGESATSMATSAETEEADMQETGQSDSSLHSHSTIAAGTASPEEHWIYDTPENVLPRRTLSSSCSTPVNHLYNSLERSSKTTDSSSLYSMDNDGYYTSMHLDSGLRPKTNRISDRTTRHSMYECIGQPGDRNSIYSDRSLSRSISLRKSKKPPLPPARTDSLQRKPKNKSGAPNGSNASVLNETLIATLQQSLQNGLKGKGSLTSSSQSPCSDYEDPWMLRSRSQSSVSAGSSGVSTVGVANVYSICHVTPSHSETSSLRSDYAESWGYYMDYPHIHGDQAQSLTRTNSVSSGGHPGRMTNGQGIHSGMQTNLPPTQSDMSAKPQVNTSSPERVHRLTSPSSGYSSQSNTPTAGTPVPSFMRSMSPSGCKPKPRVPERKSSLLSSVSISSSSTSLSSNTSDSVRNNIPPPAPPLHNSSTSLSPLTPEHFPPPLPPPSLLCTTAQSFSPPSAPALPTTPQQEAPMSTISINSSPEFPPPPPPEMLNDHDMQFNASFSPPHHPPPPPPPLPFAPTLQPPLKPSVPSAASLKGIKDSLKPVNSERRPASIHSEELGKSAMPLITAFALQSVQLRPVKRAENSMVDGSKAHEVEASQISTKPWTKDKSDHSSIMPLMSCSVPENGTLIAPSLDHKINKDNNMPETSLDNNKYEKDMPSHFLSSAPTHNAIVKAEEGELEMEEDVQAEASQPATPKKPPVISKKPKFPLVSEAAPECSAEEKHTLVIEVSELPGLQTEVANGTTEQESLHLTVVENKNDNTESSISSTETNKSESCVIQKATFETMHSSEGEREEDEIEDEDEDSSATADSVSFKDDENGEVFESGAADSPQTLSINGDVFQEMVTPTRPRTTEDLFAAIHRSKRKVLGRKESEEERLRGPSSPPATPTGPSPGFTSSLPRQSSFIQRNLRKSATSSDTFKALLLKKGSRSEGSFRMSATEMLRTTDPRFQRTRSLDSPIDLSFTEGLDSPCASPGRNKRVPDDWARSESLLPRYSLGSPSSPSSMLGPKYGRSRTPPSAASSKYNARSRILSSPMTVICERDGELTESTEGLDEPCPISPLVTSPARSKDSNGTLCEEECS